MYCDCFAQLHAFLNDDLLYSNWRRSPLSHTEESKHSEQKENYVSDSKHTNDDVDDGGGGNIIDRADDLFYQSFAAALEPHLPPLPPAAGCPSGCSAVTALRQKVALASRIRRAKRQLGTPQTQASREAEQKEQLQQEKGLVSAGLEPLATPSMCLVSFLSTWATDLLALLREARTCFDFHHLSHMDEALLLPTPTSIYEEVCCMCGVVLSLLRCCLSVFMEQQDVFTVLVGVGWSGLGFGIFGCISYVIVC